MSTTVDLSANSTDGFTIQQLYLRTKVLYPTSENDISFAGIAISTLDTTNGAWQYKLSGGSFTAFSAVVDTSSILLDFASSIRFVPNSGYTGSPVFSFVGWDGSGTVGGTADITDPADLRFTFEAYELQLNQIIEPTYSQPTLTGGPYIFTSTVEDISSSFVSVQSLLTTINTNSTTSTGLKGIAITAIDAAGQFAYYDASSVDVSGQMPNNLSDSNALLLKPTSFISYLPPANFNGTKTFTFKIWDQSAGTVGSTVDTTSSTMFSSASANAQISVTPVNDSPVINSQNISTSPIPVNGDINRIPSFTVDSLINQMTGYSDVDPNALKGIAVVANFGESTSDGMEFLFQYQLSGETGWTDISSGASVGNALLLTPSAKLRAFPRVNFVANADAYCIDIRIWDQTTGSEGQYADADYTGASSSFSANFVRIFFPPAQSLYDLYENGVSSDHAVVTNWTGPININNGVYDRYPLYAIVEATNSTLFKPVINGQHYAFDGSFVEYPGAYSQGTIVPKFFKMQPVASDASGAAIPGTTSTSKLYAMFLVGPMYTNPAAGSPLRYVTEWQMLAYPIESLGIIGDATPGGWGVETGLTKVAPYVYKAQPIRMINNNVYKFRTNNAWPNDAGAFLDLEGTISENPIFFWGMRDISFTQSTGYYNLTVDFSTYPITQAFDANIAPTLVNQRIYTIASVKEGITEPFVSSRTVSSVLTQVGSDFSDARIQVASGIAIVNIPSTSNATVQFRLTSSGNWSTLSSASSASALLLGSTAEIKVIPINGYIGELDVAFKLWDGTDNATNGSTVNTLFAAAGAYTQNFGTLRTVVSEHEAMINTRNAVFYKNNKYYLIGGDTNFINSAHAESITNLDNRYLSKIVGTDFAHAAIDGNGTVFSWGLSNYAGSLTSRPSDATTPNGLTGINVRDIVANKYAFATLDASGIVRTWGYLGSTYGATSTSTASIPTGLSTVQFRMITANNTSFAGIDISGRVWAWGDVNVGGMSTTPTLVTNLSTINTIRLISKPNGYASIDSSGILRTWGQTSFGANSTTSASTPYSTLADKNIKEVYGNSDIYLAVDTSNNVHIWGSGLGSVVTYNIIPKKVISNSTAFVIIDQSNTIYTMGSPTNGGPGYSGYVFFGGLHPFLNVPIKDVIAGERTFAAIDFSNNVYAWGDNTAGGIGYNSQEALTPINLSGVQIKSIAGTVLGFAALDISNKLWMWGGNTPTINKQVAIKPLDIEFKKIYSHYLTGTVFAVDMNNDYYIWTDHGSLLNMGNVDSTAHIGLENVDISMNSILASNEQIVMLDNSNNLYMSSSSSAGSSLNKARLTHLPSSDLSVNILNSYSRYNRNNIIDINTYAMIDGNKKLYTWGNTTNAAKNTVPLIPENLENVSVAKVCNHERATMVLDTSGTVYIYGTGITYGGSGSTRAYIPDLLKNKTIVDIIAVDAGFSILDSSGRYYAIGFPSSLSNAKNLVPTTPTFLVGQTVTKMFYVGTNAVLLQKANGEFLTFGVLSYNYLNNGNIQVFSNINPQNIYKTYYNNESAVVIDTSGYIYTLGQQNSGGVSIWGGVPTNLSGVQFQLDKVYSLDNGFAAIDTSNNLWAWGIGAFDGANGNNAGIVGTNIVSVATTRTAIASLDSSGVVRAWGSTSNGGAGGTALSQVTPTGLSGITISALYSNEFAFVAVDTSGTARAWGNASYGGMNTTTATIPTNLSGVIINKIFSNQAVFTALDNLGRLWTWGDVFGGGNSTTSAANPIKGYAITVKDNKVYSNQNSFAVLDTDGRLWTWGATTYGGSGSSTAKPVISLVNIIPAKLALSSSKYTILDTSGKVYNGGITPSYGVLSSYPVPMTTLPPVKEVYEAEYTSAALDTSGTVWTWGESTYGGSTNTNNYIPTIPAGLSGINVATIIPATLAIASIDTSGIVRAWGSSFSGGISATDRIPTNLSGVQIQRVVTNNNAFAAFDSNNIIRVWGSTSSGGINTSTAVIPTGLENIPIQRLVFNEFAFAAVNISGTVRVWGSSFYGGINSSTATIPTGLQNRVVQKIVASGNGFAVLDVSGFIYSWSGSSSIASSPINLEGRQFVDIIASSDNFSAIDTSGKVWSWGNSIVVLGNTYAGIPKNLENVNVTQIYANHNSFVAIDDLSRAYTWGATGANSISSVASTPVDLIGKQVVSVTDSSALLNKNRPISIKDSQNKIHFIGTQSVIPYSRTNTINKIPGFSTNNAPVLTFTGSIPRSGATFTVASIISDLSSSFTDVNIGDNKGIVLTTIDLTAGSMFYSNNGGSTFIRINALDNNGLVLDASSIIRYVPNTITNSTSFTGTVNYTFRVCDMTKLYYNDSFGDNGDLVPTTYYNNGIVSSSTATIAQTYNVNDYQATPRLSGGPYVVHSISEDSTNPTGFSVNTLINAVGSNYYQLTPQTKYIAVTGVATGNGTWQYKLVDGSYQTLQNFVAPTQPTVTYTFELRDQYGDGWNGNVVQIRQGSSETTVLQTIGNTFTSGTGPVTIPVSLNANSTFNLFLVGGSWPEEISLRVLNPSGVEIYNLAFGGGTSRINTILTTITTPTIVVQQGASGVSNTSALILDASSEIRFIPNTNYIGLANISFRAADVSASLVGTMTSNVNVINTGFSAYEATAQVNVENVNDAPVLVDNYYTFSTIPSDLANSDNMGTRVSTFVSVLGSNLTDIDTNSVKGIGIFTIDNSKGTWQYRLSGENWTDISVTYISDLMDMSDAEIEAFISTADALLLNTDAFVRFIPNSQYGESIFVFKAWDQTSGTNGSVVNSTYTPTGTFSSDIAYGRILLSPALNIKDLSNNDLANNGILYPGQYYNVTSELIDLSNFKLDKIVLTDSVNNQHFGYIFPYANRYVVSFASKTIFNTTGCTLVATFRFLGVEYTKTITGLTINGSSVPKPYVAWAAQNSSFNTTSADSFSNFNSQGVLDSQGNIITAHITQGTIVGGVLQTSQDIVVTKLTSTGSTVWAKQMSYSSTTSDNPPRVAVDINNDVYITWNASNNFAKIYKLAASTGNVTWSIDIKPGFNIYAPTVYYSPIDNTIVAVYVSSENEFTGGNWDVFVDKYTTANGTLLWRRGSSTFNSSAQDWIDTNFNTQRFYSDNVVIDTSGAIIFATMSSTNTTSAYQRATITKLDINGNIIWSTHNNALHNTINDVSGNSEVRVFSNAGAPGDVSATLYVGYYDSSSFVNGVIPVGNDNISSLIVPSNRIAQLYLSSNFAGSNVLVGPGTYDLASSIVSTTSGSVSVGQRVNFVDLSVNNKKLPVTVTNAPFTYSNWSLTFTSDIPLGNAVVINIESPAGSRYHLLYCSGASSTWTTLGTSGSTPSGTLSVNGNTYTITGGITTYTTNPLPNVGGNYSVANNGTDPFKPNTANFPMSSSPNGTWNLIIHNDGGPVPTISNFSLTFSNNQYNNAISSIIVNETDVNNAQLFRKNWITGLQLDASNNIYASLVVAKSTNSGIPVDVYDVRVVKLRSNSTIEWANNYGSTIRRDEAPIIKVANNVPYLTFITYDVSANKYQGGDYVVKKLSPVNGAILWRTQNPNINLPFTFFNSRFPYQLSHQMHVDTQGNVHLFSMVFGNPPGENYNGANEQILYSKLSGENGSAIWIDTVMNANSSSFNYMKGIIPYSTGIYGLIITGGSPNILGPSNALGSNEVRIVNFKESTAVVAPTLSTLASGKTGIEPTLSWVRRNEISTISGDMLSNLYTGIVRVDNSGNSYVIAGVQGGAIPGQTLKSVNDVILAKFSPNGTLLWSTQNEISTFGNDLAFYLYVEPVSGDVYMASRVFGEFTVNTTTATSDLAIQKINTNTGARIWLQRTALSSTTASENSAIIALTPDKSSLIITYHSAAAVPGGTLVGSNDIVIARLDPLNGNVLAIRQNNTFNTVNDEYIIPPAVMNPDKFSIKFDTSNNFFIATSVGTTGYQLLKFDASFNILWKLLSSTFIVNQTNALTNSYVLDSENNIYWAINIGGSVETGNVTKGGSSDTIIVKISPSGTILWRKQLDYSTPVQDTSVKIAIFNNCLYFAYGTVGNMPTSDGIISSQDYVMGRIDINNGNVLWMQRNDLFNSYAYNHFGVNIDFTNIMFDLYGNPYIVITSGGSIQKKYSLGNNELYYIKFSALTGEVIYEYTPTAAGSYGNDDFQNFVTYYDGTNMNIFNMYRISLDLSGTIGNFSGGSNDIVLAKITESAFSIPVPIMTSGQTSVITSISEDTVEASLPVTTVASIMSGLTYTLTSGTAGMALTGQNNMGYGSWQYRLNASSAWITISGLSTSNALLLGPAIEMRFLPVTNFHGTVTLSFRLWDCTFGYSGYRTAIIGDAFSLTSATASHTVQPVNDAPFIVSNAVATVTSIHEDIVDTSNTGMTVSALIATLGNNYSDADSLLLAPQAGIAVTDLSSTIGVWQYTLDNVTWTEITGVTATTALALNGAARVRLVPTANTNGQASFNFKMWDITNGVTVGSLTDASVYTTTGAFSQNSGVATIVVQAVNDAPTLDAGQTIVYTPMIANSRDNNGKTVAQILADLSGITDVDSLPPYGIAITQLPDASQSALQFKAHGSNNWFLIPTASAAAARIFDASDSIRFSPNVYYTGSTSFTFKIWDKGSGTSGGIINTATVLPGGFSVNTATATLQVTSAPTDVSAAITNVFTDLSQANVLVTSYVDTQAARPAGDVFSELATQIRDKTPEQRRAVIQALRSALSTRTGPEISDVSGAKVITISGESSFNNFTQTLAVALPNLAPKPVKVILPDFTSGTPTVVISTLDNTAFIKFELADGEQIMINADGTAVPAIYYDIGSNSYVNISGQNYNAGDFFYIGAKRFRIAGFGSVLVEPVNPPTVVSGLTVALPPIFDTTTDAANTGKTVASIFTDLSSSYNDLDSGALKGIAITALPDVSQGTFQYKMAGDVSWTDVSSAVSMTNALLLDISATIRFVIGAGSLTANNMTFKIWDQTNGSAAGTYADATYVSAGAFSQNTVIASQVVYDLIGIQTIFQIAVSTQDSIENVINALINTNTQTNSALINYIATETSASAGSISIITSYLTISYTQFTAPALLGSGAVSFGNIYEDIPEGSNTGSTITYLLSQLGANYSDTNLVVSKGIIITDATSGTWQYKTNADASWATISLGAGQVLPLDPSGIVRLLPILNYNGTLSFVFKAWNTFSGVAGVPVLESALASNSYSTATRVAEINVDARNDAPVISGTPTVVLTSILEDVTDGANVGQLVGDIIVGLSGDYSDVDANALKGVAITAISVDAGAGAWQYKLAGQSTFTNIGAVSATSALLLDVSDRIRFVPSLNYNGITELTVKGWDQTSGAPSSKVDTAYIFDGAFSAGTATVRLVITPVNDAPVFSGTPIYNMPVVAYASAANTLNGISISAVLVDISNKVVDIDTSYSNMGILLTAADVSGWEYKISGGNWTAFHTAGADAGKAVALDASSSVRFIGTSLAGGYSITYRAWDSSLGTVGTKDTLATFNTSYSSGVGTVFQAVTPDTTQVQTVAVKVSLTGVTDSRFVNDPDAVLAIEQQLAAVYGISDSQLSITFVRVMA